VVLYILLVAALDLAVGFGVAVYLGRRYRTTLAAGDSWSPDAALGPLIDGALPGEERAAAGAEILSVPSPPRPSTGAPAADHSNGAATTPAERCPAPAADHSNGAATTPAERCPAAAADHSCGAVPAQTTAGAQLDQGGPVQSSAAPPPEKSPGEQSVDDLSREVLQYQQQVAHTDERLRACAEDPQAAEIEAVLGSLLGSTQQYLESRNRSHGTFQQLHRGQAETGMICDDLQAAVQRQDEQIQRTSAMIEAFDYQSHLAEGCRQMLDQTGRLIDSNGQLRETLDAVKVKLAGNRPPQDANPAPPSDSPRELSGRTGLEAELRKWWSTQPDGVAHLSVAMIELDDSARLTQQRGGEVAGKILRAVGQLLEAAGGGEGSFLRLPGQQFGFLFPETDTRLAANAAERLRQTVQQAHLHHDEAEIRVTISCAVVGAAPEDTPGTLAERADATLREAKRYGCNRTFLHDGKYPTPVVPPVFSLAEQHATL